jgi:signal transduction histidine kinase
LASSIANNFAAVRKVLDDPDVALDLQSVSLTKLLIRVASIFQPIAWSRGIHVTVEDDKIDKVGDIECDLTLLPQVFINLVDNAVKYSIKNTEVLVRLADRDADSVVIAVSNTGIHIPVGERTRIWTSGYRSHFAIARVPGGTGIGLPIARKIVECHGGEIWVESQLKGAGSPFADTSFYVRLPLSARRG